jgi:hypothetical protein
MASEWRYRGRVVTADEITAIRQLISENRGASRRRLSEKLCAIWQWKQANGALRAMVCRGLWLTLHRAGEIELPPVRFKTLNPFVVRATPTPMLIDTTPLAVALKELGPIELPQVRRTGDARATHGRRASVQQREGAASLFEVRTAREFCDILLHLINCLKTLIAAYHRIEFAGGEFGS